MLRQILIVLIVTFLLVPPEVFARSGGHKGGHSSYSSHVNKHAGSSSSGKVHVKGHYRKDGTYVKAYERSLPLKSKSASIKTASLQSSKVSSSVASRNKNGKIARSEKAKSDFTKQHPCPSTGKTSGACPGYVIDHIVPLKRGGADAFSNMQWQTVQAAKAKDKVE